MYTCLAHISFNKGPDKCTPTHGLLGKGLEEGRGDSMEVRVMKERHQEDMTSTRSTFQTLYPSLLGYLACFQSGQYASVLPEPSTHSA